MGKAKAWPMLARGGLELIHIQQQDRVVFSAFVLKGQINGMEKSLPLVNVIYRSRVAVNHHTQNIVWFGIRHGLVYGPHLPVFGFLVD